MIPKKAIFTFFDFCPFPQVWSHFQFAFLCEFSCFFSLSPGLHFISVWRDSGVSAFGCQSSHFPEQPCWLYALITLQQHPHSPEGIIHLRIGEAQYLDFIDRTRTVISILTSAADPLDYIFPGPCLADLVACSFFALSPGLTYKGRRTQVKIAIFGNWRLKFFRKITIIKQKQQF